MFLSKLWLQALPHTNGNMWQQPCDKSFLKQPNSCDAVDKRDENMWCRKKKNNGQYLLVTGSKRAGNLQLLLHRWNSWKLQVASQGEMVPPKKLWLKRWCYCNRVFAFMCSVYILIAVVSCNIALFLFAPKVVFHVFCCHCGGKKNIYLVLNVKSDTVSVHLTFHKSMHDLKYSTSI